MKKKPTVSVVTTAYNVEKYIWQCMESVLTQTHRDIEYIVVLDCPTDGTEDIARAIAEKDDRVRLIRLNENQGCGMARRIGIEAATGEYVLLLDGDDWLNADYIERLYKRAEETDADVITGGIAVRYNNGYYETHSVTDRCVTGYGKVQRYFGKVLTMCNRLIKRDMYDKVQYCGRRYIEDLPTIIPILWYAKSVEFVDYSGFNYRVNEASLTNTASDFKKLLYEGLAWLDVIEFFDEHDIKMYEHVDIRGNAKLVFSRLAKLKITEDMVAMYKDDWCEFTRRLFNVLAVVNYKFTPDK